jgi:hypothetical protein
MKHLICVLTSVFVSGCMTAAQAPSLQPRAIELRGEAVEAASLEPMASPLDPSLAARIAALLQDATRGDAAFNAADATTAAAIRAGRRAPSGSEAWIAGEQARSALEAARQRTAQALSELDTLAIAQAQNVVANPSLGGLPELQAAQSVVEAMANRQNLRLEELIR